MSTDTPAVTLPQPLEQVFFRTKEDLAREMMTNAACADQAARACGYRTKPMKAAAVRHEREAAIWRIAAQMVMSLQDAVQPENPYRAAGSLEEAWRRGYEGRPCIAHPGSNYAKVWAEGKALASRPSQPGDGV